MSTKVMLKKVRLSFPRLYRPEQYKGTGLPRYGAVFLVEPGSDNDKLVLEAVEAELEKAFGAKAGSKGAGLKADKGTYFYRVGDLVGRDEAEGLMVLTANRKESDGAPLVINKDKTPLSESSGVVYPGCYVNALINVYVQVKDNPGIRAVLSTVQFAGDGDAFAGAPATDEDFEDLSDPDEGDDDDDMAGFAAD